MPVICCKEKIKKIIADILVLYLSKTGVGYAFITKNPSLYLIFERCKRRLPELAY
jgi:hypothetical protein